MNKGSAPCTPTENRANERKCKIKKHFTLNLKIITHVLPEKMPEFKLHFIYKQLRERWRYFVICKTKNWSSFCSTQKWQLSHLVTCCTNVVQVKAFDVHLMSDNIMLLKVTVVPRCLCFLETMNGTEIRGSLGKAKPPTLLFKFN